MQRCGDELQRSRAEQQRREAAQRSGAVKQCREAMQRSNAERRRRGTPGRRTTRTRRTGSLIRKASAQKKERAFGSLFKHTQPRGGLRLDRLRFYPKRLLRASDGSPFIAGRRSSAPYLLHSACPLSKAAAAQEVMGWVRAPRGAGVKRIDRQCSRKCKALDGQCAVIDPARRTVRVPALHARHRSRRAYFAATTRISTMYLGAASFDSTQARAGGWPGTTHLSQTEFISS